VKTPLRIGTRGSPLALAQANLVKQKLIDHHGWTQDTCELVIIRTKGDIIQDRRLCDAGGKGLFTKEIETTLLEYETDIAVHSLKDMAADDPEGLVIRTILERERPHDALILATPPLENITLSHLSLTNATLLKPEIVESETLPELPYGAVIGTASLRRQAQLLRLRPDLKIGLLRGNVSTRIAKVEEGLFTATLLAYAGLRRLNLGNRAERVLPLRPFLPAVAQGAIAIQTRQDDTFIHQLIDPLHHQETAHCVQAERAFLAQLNGSCRMPIAGYAWIENGLLNMQAEVLSLDGQTWVEHEIQGALNTDLVLGRQLGYILRQKIIEQGLNIDMDLL
jgi:hydroxymethylbilane synthase